MTNELLIRYKQWLDAYILPEKQQAMMDFAQRVWNSKQGGTVPNPDGVSSQHCNDAVSIILQFRERYLQTHDNVTDIRTVAEIRGSRFNNGKARLDLLDWEALEGLAGILEFGATKYNDHNWRKGLPFTEQVASLLRHTSAFMRGEDIDLETGKLHVDHMQCNTMFLAWTVRNRPDMDDRWKQPEVDESHKG